LKKKRDFLKNIQNTNNLLLREVNLIHMECKKEKKKKERLFVNDASIFSVMNPLSMYSVNFFHKKKMINE